MVLLYIDKVARIGLFDYTSSFQEINILLYIEE